MAKETEKRLQSLRAELARRQQGTQMTVEQKARFLAEQSKAMQEKQREMESVDREKQLRLEARKIREKRLAQIREEKEKRLKSL